MFRALAQGSHLAALEDSGKSLQLLPPAEETASADALRHAVCDELRAREEDFAPFIDYDEAGSFNSYVENMRRPSTWGGEPELAVAAGILGRTIAVHQQASDGGALDKVSEYDYHQNNSSTRSSIGTGQIEKKSPETVHLLFHGAGHYDLLVKRHGPRSKL